MLRNARYVEAGAVAREVFDDVQTFMGERGATFNRDPKGRLPGGAGRGFSALLGLFRCAECGGPITTVKRDETDRRVGCRRHNGEGDCSMGVTVRERVLLQRLIDEVNRRVLAPAVLGGVTARANAQAAAAASTQRPRRASAPVDRDDLPRVAGHAVPTGMVVSRPTDSCAH